MSKFAVASLSITHRIVHLGYNVVHIPHCCFKKGCWKKGQKCMWQSWKVTGYQWKMYKTKQFIKSTMSHSYRGIFCDFPEILRSSNCDLKTTYNFSFWGCCMHLSGFFPQQPFTVTPQYKVHVQVRHTHKICWHKNAGSMKFSFLEIHEH